MLDPQHLKRPPMVTAASSSSSLALRPQGPLSRPLFSSSGSSSSSLGGLEQTVLPFQDFIKQTRPVDAEKPLPPTPLAPRHSFDSSPYSEDRRSQLFDLPHHEKGRRSSSVYSRTQSQWIPEDPRPDTRSSYQSPENEDESYFPPNPHNMDVPGVDIRQPTPDSQEPRECSPLIASPCSTLSAVSTVPKSQPIAFMRNPLIVQERPKVRMMSLDKANQKFNAPGAVHMLPEELRAQKAKKSDARKYTRTDVTDSFGSPRPPPLPPAAFEFRGDRSHSTSTGASVSPFTPSPRDSAQGSSYVTSMNTFHVGTGPARTMAPPFFSTPQHQIGEDEERGRTRQRGRASREYPSPPKFFMHDLNTRAIPEYDSDPYRQPSASGSYQSDDDDVRGHMKLIPQPLFQAKSPIQHRIPSNAGSPSSLGYSPFRMQRSSQESASSGRSSGFPLRLSLTPPPEGTRQRESNNSTTGMIPISPPTVQQNESRRSQKPPPINTDQKNFTRAAVGPEARVSSLYPHIMSRNKKKKIKASDAKSAAKRPSVGAPLLPAEVVAAVLLTPETTPQTSPLASNLALTSGLKRAPSNLSTDGKRPLYQRFKGITKLRRGSKQQELSPGASSAASPESPHLFPSPVKSLPPTHLGWTETAKATWDQARTAFPSRSHASQATSPDGDASEMEDSDSPTLSRPTLFGPFMESYRETKAQKRREDLKKTIKVFTPLDGASEVGDSDDGSEEGSAIQKRLSNYNWM